jgi:hypothetical protein
MATPTKKVAQKKKKKKTLVAIGGQGNPQRQSYTQQQVCNEHLRSVLLVGRDKPHADSPAALCS